MLLPMLFLPKENGKTAGFWQYLWITIYIVNIKKGYQVYRKILYTL